MDWIEKQRTSSTNLEVWQSCPIMELHVIVALGGVISRMEHLTDEIRDDYDQFLSEVDAVTFYAHRQVRNFTFLVMILFRLKNCLAITHHQLSWYGALYF